MLFDFLMPAATEACFSLGPVCFSPKIDAGLLLTVVLFFAGYFITSWIERRKRRVARRSFIKALAEEIKLNVKSLEKATTGFPSGHDINVFMALDPNNRPYVTFSYFSVIYSSHTEILQDLPDIMIRNIVEFYGNLANVAIDVAAIDKDSFSRISQRGREECLSDIMTELQVVLQLGRSISDAIDLQLLPYRIF
jgi:hypothetical protein